jgi:hypothetical protein
VSALDLKHVEDREYLRFVGTMSLIALIEALEWFSLYGSQEDSWKKEVMYRALDRKRLCKDPWTPPTELKDPSALMEHNAPLRRTGRKRAQPIAGDSGK